jgi:hypothetical protein
MCSPVNVSAGFKEAGFAPPPEIKIGPPASKAANMHSSAGHFPHVPQVR